MYYLLSVRLPPHCDPLPRPIDRLCRYGSLWLGKVAQFYLTQLQMHTNTDYV